MTDLNEQRLRRSLEQAAGEVDGAGDPAATWQRASRRVVQRRRRRRAASAAGVVVVVALAAAAVAPQLLEPSEVGAPDVAGVDEQAGEAGGEPPADEGEGEEPGSSAAGTQQAPPASLAKTCVNEQDGFAVNYPDDWHAREGRCSAFGTEPLGEPKEIGGGGMLPGVHITGNVREAEFDEYVRRTVERSDTTDEILDREQHRIDGRRALRVEKLASGGAYPEPTRVTSWIVELDARRVLTLHTNDARGPERYRKDVEALDAIAQSARPLPRDQRP